MQTNRWTKADNMAMAALEMHARLGNNDGTLLTSLQLGGALLAQQDFHGPASQVQPNNNYCRGRFQI